MHKIIILCLATAGAVKAAPSGHDLERYRALSQIETGDNDRAIGRVAHEVSRYSIRPDIWTRVSRLPLSAAINSITAVQVAEAVMEPRIKNFTRQHGGRKPNDIEWVLLWHCPAHVSHPNQTEKDYAIRFSNLMSGK